MAYNYDATVVRWVDGDTVWLEVDLGFRITTTTDFRLAGVDTPERGQPNHDEAVTFVNTLAPAGSRVAITTFKAPDKYGRWMANITVPGGGPTVNYQLLGAKLAVPYFGGKK